MCGRAQIDGRATSAQLRGHRCPLPHAPPKCPLQNVPPRCPLQHVPPKCPPPCRRTTSMQLLCFIARRWLTLQISVTNSFVLGTCLAALIIRIEDLLYKDGTRDAKVYFNIKVKKCDDQNKPRSAFHTHQKCQPQLRENTKYQIPGNYNAGRV